MKRIDNQVELEAGDILQLVDGRKAEFISFNVWDTGLMYVNIDGYKECIFTSQLNMDLL